MDSFIQDIRYGLRMLWKAPGFTLVAIAALALGIGANTAIFSVVNAVMLRPLPFPQSARLIDIYHSYPGIHLNRATVSPITLDFYQKNNKAFESIGAYTGYRAPSNLTGNGEPQRVRAISVNGDFFKTMGIAPAHGRSLIQDDDQPGHNRVVVLSNGLWKRQFGSDASMIGKTITLDGNNYDVVGIMPASFDFPPKADLWVPMGFTAEQMHDQAEYLTVVGRLKPGVTLEQAREQMKQWTAGIRQLYAKEFEGDTSGWHVECQPLTELIRGDLRPALMVLLAAVGCVLLIACVNIANLLLARATARQREIATRVAIGATRLRMIRQLVTESVVLAVAGGAAGLLVGYFGVNVLLTMLPMDLPSFIQIGVDPTVMAFTAVLSIATGVIFGLAPAWRISSPELVETLKEGRSSVGSSHHKLRDALVVGEMAMAVLLLVGAGLMIRSFIKYQGARFGFDPQNVMTFSVSLPKDKYSDPVRVRSFYQQAIDKISTLPGVESAGVVTTLPMTGSGWTQTYTIQGKDIHPEPHSYFAVTSAGYFKALGVRLIRGRVIQPTDGAETPLVAVIDDKAAKMYFGNDNPIGQLINMQDKDPVTKQPRYRQIVGVVGSVKHSTDLGEDTKGQVYLAYTQLNTRDMDFAVRTNGDPTAIMSSVRTQLREVDPEQPVYDAKTMEKIVEEAMAQPKFNTVLLGIFGGLALVLAAVGIYGVLSYTVTQRTHEIGLRMALGASQGSVLKMVINHALKLAAIGIVVGIVAAMAATKALTTLLYQVSRTDPITYVGIVVILGGVALLASYAPARRATRVDPMIALRNE